MILHLLISTSMLYLPSTNTQLSYDKTNYVHFFTKCIHGKAPMYIYLAAYYLAKMMYFYNRGNIHDWSCKSILGYFHAISGDNMKLQDCIHTIMWQYSVDLTLCRYMALWNMVDIGSGNGLLPADTKPLPESMLTCNQWGFTVFKWGNCSGNVQDTYRRHGLDYLLLIYQSYSSHARNNGLPKLKRNHPYQMSCGFFSKTLSDQLLTRSK